ncbi:flocculation-associated PEP-CTERM protein PepA [Thalassotalea piscium]
MKLRNTILALVLAGATSAVNASEIDFKGSQYGGFDVTFDLIDFLPETANVTQTDDTSGDLSGNDGFQESGLTSVVSLTLNNVGVPYYNTSFDSTPGFESDMVLFFDYNIQGMATNTGAETVVNFTNVVNAELYLYWDADADNTTGTSGRETRVSLANFMLNQGSCNIESSIDAGTGNVSVNSQNSSCGLNLAGNFAAGNFYSAWGQDLSTLVSPVTVDYTATVQKFNGLNYNYNGAATQDFTITHDANMSINVPEPTSIAILGLGLLGLAGTRRRS